ncbi:MAG: Flp pilus assembly complex ATPase component TadA [Planctomycetaceae bacterium]|nr:Flp pilus assembly complex ATPase component TadA [Planctomycetaceae bacterium]
MIFGFGRKKKSEDEEEEFDVDREQVLFQGAINDAEVDLSANARLAQAGLGPAKQLVTDALERRCNQLILEPKGKATAVLYFVDGIRYPGTRMPAQQGLAVIQMLKLLGGLDTKQRKKPQSGGIRAEFDSTPYELRTITLPTEAGERLTVNIRNLKESLETPDDLGFTEDLRSRIRSIAERDRGLMLACGGPYSGVTTSMFAMLQAIDVYMYTINTLGDMQGRELHNIRAFEGNEGDDFIQTIERAARAESDIMCIEPLRPNERLKEVMQVQKKMCLVSEFPARDAASGVLQLIKWVGSRQEVAQAVQCILSQKLIRVLCEKCREAYPANPKLVQRVGLPPETSVLYRPPKEPEDPALAAEYVPCRRCGGVGYYGRAGLYELLEFTDSMRELVARKGTEVADIKALARKEKMITLQQEGLRFVAEGRTSLEELQRAFRG